MFWLALRVISNGNGFNFDKRNIRITYDLNVMRRFVLSRKYHNFKASNEVVMLFGAYYS